MINLFKMYQEYKAKKRKKFLLNAFRNAYMSIAERNFYSCSQVKWAFNGGKEGNKQSDKYWNLFRPDSTVGPNARIEKSIISSSDMYGDNYDDEYDGYNFSDDLHEWRVTALCFAMAMIEAGDWE